MSDLIAELQRQCPRTSVDRADHSLCSPVGSCLHCRAAGEIERLRATLDNERHFSQIRDDCDDGGGRDPACNVGCLACKDREIERLTADLAIANAAGLNLTEQVQELQAYAESLRRERYQHLKRLRSLGWSESEEGTVGGLGAALLKAERERDEARAEAAKWRRIRTPTHGPCCTCQACGQFYDDCRCDLDDVADDNKRLRALLTRCRDYVLEEQPTDKYRREDRRQLLADLDAVLARRRNP